MSTRSGVETRRRSQTWFGRWAARAFERAMHDNVTNLASLLFPAPERPTFVDLGCDDGELTQVLAAILGTDDVHGVEIVAERAEHARSRGVEVRLADLNEPFPYAACTFDVAVSHQVIEHLIDLDNFASELYRILRPGGFALVSTENLASWHNIAALTLGWQPFSLTNLSRTVLGVGNPLSLHRNESALPASWRHVHVLASRGLTELLAAHGFEVEVLLGAGYYPLPARLSRWDFRHAVFLTTRVRRPLA